VQRVLERSVGQTIALGGVADDELRGKGLEGSVRS
jgi:hypothetical protein